MAQYEDRECFIPISKHHLIEALAREYQGEREGGFRHFVDILSALYHFKFHSLSEELKESYEPFNPDKDVTIFSGLTEQEEELHRRELIDLVDGILDKGNFTYLNEQDLSDLLSEHGHLGIQIEVDPDQYRHFSLYVRGEAVLEEKKRTWSTLWLWKKNLEVPYYKRVVIMLQGIRMDFPPLWKQMVVFVLDLLGWKGARKLTHRVELHREINLKVFKDIRKDSLQMLFPYVRMRMSLFDRVKIGVPFVGGVILVIFKIIVAAALSPITLLVLLGTFIGYIVKTIFGYQTTKDRYLKKLTENLYYNSLDNNQGVFSYLVDSAEEEEIKEALLALHFLWNREKWSLGQVTLAQLDNHIEGILEEHFGVVVDFDVEDALGKLGYRQKGEKLDQCEDGVSAASAPLGLLLQPEETSFLIEEGAKKDATQLSIPPSIKDNLPLQGTLEAADGSVKIPFVHHPWKFEIQNTQFQGGARSPHPLGSVIAWQAEEPYRAKIAAPLTPRDSHLDILDPPVSLPLMGKATIGEGDKQWTFYYSRKANENRLYFWKPLLNFDLIQKGEPIFLRLVPPVFETKKELPAGTNLINIEGHFSHQGIVSLVSPQGEESFYPFIQDHEKGALHLKEPLKTTMPPGTRVSLSSLTGFLDETTYGGSHSLCLRDASLFHAHGTLRIDGGTKKEEILEFRRELFQLDLATPPKKKHPLGSTIYIYSQDQSLKVKLIQAVDRQRTKLLVYGSLPFPPRGKAVFEPGTKNHEEMDFTSQSRIIYLPQGTKYTHPEGTKVQQDTLSTPLIQPLFPSSRTVIVKDGSPFPLRGQAVLEQKGTVIEGPFPYRRASFQNPHTIFLVDQPPRAYPQATSLEVIRVEKISEGDIHVDSTELEADFSQVAEFSQEGTLILEPASPYEEEVYFRRSTLQIELATPLPVDLPPGSLCKLSYHISGSLAQKARWGEERIELEDTSLFPQEGEIQIGEQVVEYEKMPNILFLSAPLVFHHSQHTLLRMGGLAQEVFLTESAKKGERRISINTEEGVPNEGAIHLGTGAQTRKYTYQKKGQVLFLNKPLEIFYWRKTSVFFPDFQSKSHLSPGDTLLEVVEGDELPEKGVLLIEPDTLHSSETFLKNLIYKLRPAFLESRQERVEYCKKENVLWLKEPLQKEGEPGEEVKLLTLSPQSFANLEPLSIKDASVWLDCIWDNIFQDSNEYHEPSRHQRKKTAGRLLKKRSSRKRSN